jgi:hypothetical protein
MEDYLDLTFDIFDETDQRASVRMSLTVEQLIAEVLQEFEGLEQSNPAAYALTLEGRLAALDVRRTLVEQGVQNGDHLVFGWVQKSGEALRQPLQGTTQVALQEASTGSLYPITWQPARIGRPDADPAHNELLAVNLEWLPAGRSISRRHAQITERAGGYYLESLTSQNPTSLNDKALVPGQTVRLNPGDRITLGHNNIELTFIIT